MSRLPHDLFGLSLTLLTMGCDSTSTTPASSPTTTATASTTKALASAAGPVGSGSAAAERQSSPSTSELATRFDGPGPANIAIGKLPLVSYCHWAELKAPTRWSYLGTSGQPTSKEAFCAMYPWQRQVEITPQVAQHHARLAGWPVSLELSAPVRGRIGAQHIPADIYQAQGKLRSAQQVATTHYVIVPDASHSSDPRCGRVIIVGSIKETASAEVRRELTKCLSSFRLTKRRSAHGAASNAP